MSIATSEQVDWQLDLLRAQLQHASYPGYPEQAARYSCSEMGQKPIDSLVVPDGPWTIDSHPNRPDNEVTPNDQKQSELLQQGYRLDARGRPIHPWFETMVSDITIGVVSGKGAYWQWGPNRTADALVVHRERLLLVQRGDNGTWAVPGGFINKNEPAYDASLRELHEETGLLIPAGSQAQILYDGPVADPRITAHAWPETTAIAHMITDSQVAEVSGRDDAIDAAWVAFGELHKYPMFGAHRMLAELAMQACLE